MSHQIDVLVESDFAGNFCLVLEARIYFKLVLLVAELEFVGRVVFLLLEIIGVRKVFVRDFVPKHNLLAELNGAFDLILAGVSLDIE